MPFTLTDMSGCDVRLTVTETKQYITTEGYPNSYPDNQDCNFNFVAPSGRNVILYFEDFHLETEFDYVVFRKLKKYNLPSQKSVLEYLHHFDRTSFKKKKRSKTMKKLQI